MLRSIVSQRAFQSTIRRFSSTNRLKSTVNLPKSESTQIERHVQLDPRATPALQQHLTVADRIALRFRDYLPNTTQAYVAYEVTKDLYSECAIQAGYIEGQKLSPPAEFWYNTCGRPPTFNSWAQVTVLHMWILAARMRALDKGRVTTWQQNFIDHFFYDSEDKMMKHYDIKSASQRGGYMKDLYHQYRGMTAAFDEGLVKGDAILATAIWRNLFDAVEDVDPEILAMITSHVRRAVSKLGRVNDEIILTGRVSFGSPTEEISLVCQNSTFLQSLEHGPEPSRPILGPGCY